MDRREFCLKVVKGTAFLSGLPLLSAGLAQAAGYRSVASRSGRVAPIVTGRQYQSGKIGLEFGGKFAGWVASTEGGHVTSDVVEEHLGADHITRKHIGTVKYEDITIECGASMDHALYDWIVGTFNHSPSRKDGAILSADFDGNAETRLEFTQALIKEIGFPALDAASKDAARLKLTFTPEITRMGPGSGKVAGAIAAQKQWQASGFRLAIAGLEGACKKVSKIEALVVKQKLTGNPVGEARDYQMEPVSLEVPNLVITLPESQAQPFYDWLKDFVVLGHANQANEKTGTLEFLTPNLQQTLFTLTFSGLGIFKADLEKVESGADGLRNVRVEMYCEEISLAYDKGLAGVVPPA